MDDGRGDLAGEPPGCAEGLLRHAAGRWPRLSVAHPSRGDRCEVQLYCFHSRLVQGLNSRSVLCSEQAAQGKGGNDYDRKVSPQGIGA